MDENKDRMRWLNLYISLISLIGLLVIVFAVVNLPEDRLGLLVFALLAAIAELSSVELFSSSRSSRVSVSGIIAIASILVFGPLAGVFTHMVSGLITVIPNTLLTKLPKNGRVSWIRRLTFNIGMFVIAAASAGWVYSLAGGSFESVARLSNLFPLVATATVDTLANIAILIGVLALQTGRNPFYIWGQNFRWSVPISILGGALGGGLLALGYERFGVLGLAVFFLPVLSIGYSFRLYANHTRQYVNKLEEMNRSLDNVNLSLLEMLGAVIDADDRYTYGHSKQVTDYVGAMAEKMDLSEEQKSAFHRAALIHDIGKVSIRDSIISKPGPLDQEERDEMRRHPMIGADIISHMEGLQELVPIVRHHHERWDGNGYPAGLAAEEIPLGARVIAVADSFDAMYSNRPYRPAMPFDLALQEIRRCSGSQFDPQVVQAFFAVVEEKGAEFFKNSDAAVDASFEAEGTDSPARGLRYSKRSMVLDSKNGKSAVEPAHIAQNSVE